MSDALLASDPVAAARACLAHGALPFVVLCVHEFADDAEAHDDALQGRLRQAFEKAFAEAAISLQGAFGHANSPLDRSDADTIPLSGVFRAATWAVAGHRVFLAAAHEDRETPLLLVVGVAD